MKSPALLRLVWLVAGLALLLGLARESFEKLHPRPRELPRFDGATGRPWFTGDFAAAGPTPAKSPDILPSGIPHVSSWVDGDQWQGRAESAWFKVTNRWIVHVGVKGYPRLPGCHLRAEFRSADGSLSRLDCPLPNPREDWSLWEIRLPSGTVAMRVVGEDLTSAHTGWIAFSHPFRAWSGLVTAGFQFLQLVATTCLALTLVWGPGLLWTSCAAAPPTRLAGLLGTGPLLLAALGVAIWALGPLCPPPTTGPLLVGTLWLALGLGAHRRSFDLAASPTEARALALSALIVAAVVAKSAHSVGPQGELFRGTISRNFEMSDRIDSRFSFYAVQAAAHGWGPASPETERFYAPWTFFSRGPLAGLAAIPVVMAVNSRPPTTLPEDRWSPFDATGFAAYRVTVIVLSASVIVAFFLALVPLLGEHRALGAAGLLALSPFGVHEVMFTWPKWPATAGLLASFAFAHARRPLAAGLALGVGFLFHPLALLWSPWLALWAAGRTRDGGPFTLGPALHALLRFGAGSAALVVPWMLAGALAPHLPDTPLAGQAGFLRYWILADWQFATWDTWWRTRWMNFANTFVPLHLALSDASFNHPKLGSAYEPSGPLVKLAELWWNSLPFALGLGLWALCLATLARALRVLRAAAWLFILLPALFIVAYWGMDPLGLMRECGHPLLIALIALACVIAAREGGRADALLRHRATPWLQLPETALMLWLTALLNPSPWPANFAHLDSLHLALNALALLGAAWVLSRHGTAPR